MLRKVVCVAASAAGERTKLRSRAPGEADVVGVTQRAGAHLQCREAQAQIGSARPVVGRVIGNDEHPAQRERPARARAPPQAEPKRRLGVGEQVEGDSGRAIDEELRFRRSGRWPRLGHE